VNKKDGLGQKLRKTQPPDSNPINTESPQGVVPVSAEEKVFNSIYY
jgi:hypothetical protein